MIEGIILSLVILFLLSGCMPIGLPALIVDVPALTYMSYGKSAFDVASFTGSGKSLSDHMISNMMGKDCAMFNIISKDRVCKEKDINIDRFSHLIEG